MSLVRPTILALALSASLLPNELELTIYPAADHDAWTRTYDLSAGNDVYAWLLEHERK